MKKHWYLIGFIFCILLFSFNFVHADKAKITPYLEVDGNFIDLSDHIFIESNQLVIKNLSRLSLLGIKAELVPAEQRIILEYKKSTLSIQIIHAALTKVKDIYVVNGRTPFLAAVKVRAGKINLLDNNSHIQLTTQGKEQQTEYLIYSIKPNTGIQDIHRVSFKKEASKYTNLYSKALPMPKTYVPTNMIKLPKTIRAVLSKGSMQLNKDAAADLARMLEQASKDEIKNYLISSTYRDYKYQHNLFINQVSRMKRSMRTGYEDAAAMIVARPGTSEHQSGLAMDITKTSMSLVNQFGSTPEGRWLAQNSWKYGFVLRYNMDKISKTEIIYEPWHFRYLGYPHSKILFDNNLCLEEYHGGLAKYGFYATADEGHAYIIVKDSKSIQLFESIPIVMKQAQF